MWAKWWTEFMKPVTDILGKLCNGNLYGTVPYDQRKKNKYALQSHITARRLSHKDFYVIKRVDVDRGQQYIAAIEMEEARVRNRWQPVLQSYLHDAAVATHPVHSDKQVCSSSDAAAGVSSARPLAINDAPPEIAPPASGKRSQSERTSKGG